MTLHTSPTKPLPQMNVLGIMSGTSLDGADLAWCQIQAQTITLKKLWSFPFTPTWRKRLELLVSNQASSYEVGQTHHDLGRLYASFAKKALSDTPSGFSFDLAGCHGQTIYHNPSPQHPATYQIGEPQYLANTLRCPVAHNFRVADLSAGGQGAPLATHFHLTALAAPGQITCVNNLGGISNVTYIDLTTPSTPNLLAFDTGPANILLDLSLRTYTQHRKTFDKNGALAAQGEPIPKLLKSLLRDPYFNKRPPKSSGHERFGLPCFHRHNLSQYLTPQSLPHLLSTLTEFTAISLARQYQKFLPKNPNQILFTGGGALNPYLLSRLHHHLHPLYPHASIRTCQDLHWPPASIEPAAFAWLTYLAWHNHPGTLPQTTGAQVATLTGTFTHPIPKTT